MKKFWLLSSALVLSIVLTACSDNSGAEADKKDSKESAASSESNGKGSLVRFYSEMTKTINETDADLNAFEAAEETPTADMKAKASESAAAVADQLSKLEVSDDLKDQKADLEAAIKTLAESYTAKSEELKKDSPSLDAANAKFTEGEEQLGKVFESVKLMKPSLATEVNG